MARSATPRIVLGRNGSGPFSDQNSLFHLSNLYRRMPDSITCKMMCVFNFCDVAPSSYKPIKDFAVWYADWDGGACAGWRGFTLPARTNERKDIL